MIVCDIEVLGEEVVRAGKFFKRSYERTIHRLLDGNIRNLERDGRDLLETVAVGLKATEAVSQLFAASRKMGYTIESAADVTQLTSELTTIQGKIAEQWPFTDHEMIERAREDFKQGKYRTCGEPLHGPQSKSA